MSQGISIVLSHYVSTGDHGGWNLSSLLSAIRSVPWQSRRFYGVLTAAVLTGVVFMPTSAMSASSRHPVHPGHRAVQKMASKPIQRARAKPVQHGRTNERLNQVGSATRYTERVHKGSAVLINTTWDNPKIPSGVMNAIQSAAQKAGIDPHLLAAVAWRESRFDPSARSRQSSATGLLQFTKGTWLQAIRDCGERCGVGAYADAIEKSRSGELIVSNKQLRAEILQRRGDPVLSAKLAAEQMRLRQAAMQDRLGRNVRSADLYLLHVLGPSGSARFLSALVQHPTASSLNVASSKVMANAGLLARDHRPMTVAKTYAAVEAMLSVQQGHSEQAFADPRAGQDIPLASVDMTPTLIEVSQAP